jgi:hypothetical protein
MPKTINKMDFLSDFFDAIGLTSFITGLFLNITAFFLNITWNQSVTFIMSILGIIYICIKIYDGCLSIRQRRKDYKK